jgi:hypothetical protein
MINGLDFLHVAMDDGRILAVLSLLRFAFHSSVFFGFFCYYIFFFFLDLSR